MRNAKPSRRAIAAGVLIAAAIAGAVVRQLTEKGTTPYYVGTLFMVLWVPVVGNIIAYFIRKWRAKYRAETATAEVPPFVAHLLVEITMRQNRRSVKTTFFPPGEFACLFVIGNEGFSARLLFTDGLQAGEASRVEAQFLAPAAALPKFPAGTDFSMQNGSHVVGNGRVVEPIMQA